MRHCEISEVGVKFFTYEKFKFKIKVDFRTLFLNQGWFQVNLEFKVDFMSCLKNQGWFQNVQELFFLKSRLTSWAVFIIKVDFKMNQKPHFITSSTCIFLSIGMCEWIRLFIKTSRRHVGNAAETESWKGFKEPVRGWHVVSFWISYYSWAERR